MSIDITAHITIDNENVDSTFDWDSIPTVHMANGNARVILTHLGFDPFQITTAASQGLTVTPLDMRARCTMVLALPQFIESTDTVRVGNHIVFGTDNDYIIDRIHQILELVEWCDSRGMNVAIY